jgi:hypothetical protein
LGHNLAKEIKAMMEEDSLDEILKLSPTLRKAFEEGAESGRLELLREGFAVRVGRAPTPDEEAALARRTQEIGANQTVRALVRLHGDALIAWLLGSGPIPERAG